MRFVQRVDLVGDAQHRHPAQGISAEEVAPGAPARDPPKDRLRTRQYVSISRVNP
jgi:hypothetical protein